MEADSPVPTQDTPSPKPRAGAEPAGPMAAPRQCSPRGTQDLPCTLLPVSPSYIAP